MSAFIWKSEASAFVSLNICACIVATGCNNQVKCVRCVKLKLDTECEVCSFKRFYSELCIIIRTIGLSASHNMMGLGFKF